MGTLNRLYKVFILLFLLAPGACLAADMPAKLHFIGLYRFDWSGIPLGALELGMDESPDSYSLRLLVVSKGIVNLFTHHMSETTASGKRIGDSYMPQQYESRYKTKNKPRHIKLAFDGKGAVSEEIVEPPEDRTERAEVPHALKDGSFDPLGGLMMVLSGHAQFRAFNAKQLYAITVKPNDKITVKLNNTSYPAMVYTLSRAPLAGMTAKETREYNKGEPPLSFFMSDDARRIPLGISMPIYMSNLRGVLVKECTEWEECRP